MRLTTSCFGGAACFRREEFHTPAPWRRAARRGDAAPGEWTPASPHPDGFASPLGGGSVASSVRSFYSAASAYTDAADDIDGAESGSAARDGAGGGPGLRSSLLLPQAPAASVRRFLRFDAAADGGPATGTGSDASEVTVIPATPTADQTLGVPALGVAPADADDGDAVSIGGPPSPGRAETSALDGAVTALSASAVPSHPLNVDDDEEEMKGEEAEVQGAAPPAEHAEPALIPALQAAASAEALPPAAPGQGPLAAGGAMPSPVRPASAGRAGGPPSDGAPSLWGRVFGAKGAAPAVAGEAVGAAAPAASKPAPLVAPPAPAALAPVVTEMTAAGPAGSAAATADAAPRKGRLFGW